MEGASTSKIEELQWKDIRKQFLSINPTLGKIIDAIDPPKKYTFFKVSYPFGSEILRDGILQLPNNHDHKFSSLYDEHISPAIREKLGYNYGSNPVCMALKNTSELFIQLENRIVPLYGIIPPGKVFGLWRILNPEESHNPTFIWGMTAGARSLFMLPKISRDISHKKLQQKLGIKIGTPKNLLEHWNVFREIAKNIEQKNPWRTELLFFSKAWFESLHDKAWLEFHNWLLVNVWSGSEFFRNDFIWQAVFSAIQEKCNIRPEPYVTNTIKHLFAMSIGAVPGFSPAIDDTAAPISKIQTAYQEIYNIDYIPTIMQPFSFSYQQNVSRPVYYSLAYPTIIELPLKNRALANKITDLSLIAYLLDKFRNKILEGKLNLERTSYYNGLQNVAYDFFHSDASAYPNLKYSRDIPLEDNNFLLFKQNLTNAIFAENSPFLRGCVRISAKTESNSAE